MLATQGHLALEGDHWRLTNPLPDAEAKETAATILEAAPAYATDLALMLRCGEALPRILRGEPEARAVLFSAEALAELKKFYREAPASAFYNRLLTAAVGEVIADSDGSTPIRIVELGGGTGGATAPLLAALPPGRVHYTFTDISPFFVAAAEREFRNVADFRAIPLDLERELAAQDFAPHSADVVIAANVFHATADLAQSLARARQLLAPNGLLVLLEITRRPDWLNVIFGVTEGWWKFTDRELRPRHPLLDTEQWESLLTREGFSQVTALTDTAHPGSAGQSVLLAHSAGTEKPKPASENESAHWLIVADRAGVAERLAAIFAERGEKCLLVREDFRAAFGNAEQLRGVILLGALDCLTSAAATAEDLLAQQRVVCEQPLQLLAALDAAGTANRPNFTFVTAAAQAVNGKETLALSQSPLWGLARVILRERADLRSQLVDLDRDCSDAALRALAREICEPSAEEELALRGNERWVRRMARPAIDPTASAHTLRAPKADESWHLQIGSPGALETLRFEVGERAGTRA